MLKKLINLYKNCLARIDDDTFRLRFELVLVFSSLSIVSLVMTIVNIITSKNTLMLATLVFSIVSMIGVLLAYLKRINVAISSTLMVAVTYVLFIYFIISGNPEGFSVIWICLLPSLSLFLFGKKKGSIVCLCMFIIIIFFFYSNLGRSLLNFDYTTSFKLRFPILFTSFYCVSLITEIVRFRTHQKMIETRKQFQFLSNHDSLTNLYNRKGFNDMIEKTLKNCHNDGLTLSIIDIDHFKEVNDTYGHIIGDKVLIDLSNVMRDCVGYKGDVCRWGGEEFAVLTYKEESIDFPEELRKIIEEKIFDEDGNDINITISVGFVKVNANARIEAEELLKAADACLYSAKNNGRNQVVTKEIVEKDYEN